MHPEDRLDALLTACQRPERVRGDDLARTTPGADVQDDALHPLVRAAQLLEPLRAARPSAQFALDLQDRLLAQAAQRRHAAAAPGVAIIRRPGLRTLLPAGPINVSAIARGALRPALAAAAVMLALGLGLLSVAAAAPPGSPLFGLRRIEERAELATAPQTGDRARLYLTHARQWLTALHDAALQQRGDPTYSDALRALRDDDSAAVQEIAGLPPTRERATLEAQLTALHADERTTLQDALRSITWSERLATTRALGDLGVTVPRVTRATIDTTDAGVRVILAGAGFQPGAVLLVNGQRVGTVTAVADGRLVVMLSAAAFSTTPVSLGVGNPDGTATALDDVRVPVSATPDQHDDTSGPDEHNQPTATPGGDEHTQATPQPTSNGSGGTASPTPGN